MTRGLRSTSLYCPLPLLTSHESKSIYYIIIIWYFSKLSPSTKDPSCQESKTKTKSNHQDDFELVNKAIIIIVIVINHHSSNNTANGNWTYPTTNISIYLLQNLQPRLLHNAQHPSLSKEQYLTDIIDYLLSPWLISIYYISDNDT